VVFHRKIITKRANRLADGKDPVVAKTSKCYKKGRGNRVVLMLLTNTLFLWDTVARGSTYIPSNAHLLYIFTSFITIVSGWRWYCVNIVIGSLTGTALADPFYYQYFLRRRYSET
jgi:hypothetical protein